LTEKKEFEKRINNVTRIIKNKGLKGVLIYYDELNISNGWYLSGWCPQFESGCILVTDNGQAYILGGPESEPFAKTDSAIKETRNMTVFMVPDEEYPMATIVSFKEVFSEVFGNTKINKIGIVGMKTMPYGVYKALVEDIRGIELVDITSEYEALRIIKSPYEISLIQKSFEIADAAFKEMISAVKEGVSETYLAGIADGRMKMLGANGFGYKTIVAAGKRSNGVVPTASDRILKNEDMILLGISPRYKGYASSAGFTTIVGEKMDKGQKDYLKMISEAFIISREMMKPGMIGKDNYAKIKKFFREKGEFDKYIICPFIHTDGLNEAEAPFFGPNSNDMVQPNMVLNIDISLWSVPKFNGIRFETGYLITENGYTPFSPFMDKLIESIVDI